jgi:hypothetical protein
MFSSVYSQLFIEGENNHLYVYIHLKALCADMVSEILDKYIKCFKKYDFEKMHISFWNVNLPGEHLSSYRKTSNRAISKILRGFKHIDSCYDFRKKQKVIPLPQVVH